jgi:hypothetical protein
MMQICQTLFHAARALAKFMVLTLVTVLALAVGVLINIAATASILYLWLPASGSQILNAGISYLVMLSHFLKISGA